MIRVLAWVGLVLAYISIIWWARAGDVGTWTEDDYVRFMEDDHSWG